MINVQRKCAHVVYWSFVSTLVGKLGSPPPISGSISADSSSIGVTDMLDDGTVVCEEVSASWMSSVVSVTSSKDMSSSSSTERSGTVGVASGAVSGGMLSALSLPVGRSGASVSTPALLLLVEMRVVFVRLVLAKRDT